MSQAAALVAQLAAAGTPPELLAAVAKELFAGESALETIEARKRKDRERHPRKSEEIHGTPQASEEVSDRVSLDKEKPPTPPKEINPIPYVRDTRAKAKHPLPANWTPAPLKPDGQAGEITVRKPVGWIERELSKFKDHALQNRRLCADWDAAWRNWIKQADEYDGQQRTNSLGRNQPSDGLSATTRAARDVFGLGAGH